MRLESPQRSRGPEILLLQFIVSAGKSPAPLAYERRILGIVMVH